LSTERALSVRGTILASFLFAVFTPTARAAQVDFRPVLSFGVFHSGNVLLVGYDPATGQQSNPVSDDLAILAVDLAVDRNEPGSKFSFLYRPTYAWYRERSDLDYFGNMIELKYAKEASRRSGMSVSLDGTRTDFQGITAQNADRPDSVVPRTTITRAYAVVEGSAAVAQRGLLDWQVHGGLDHYDAVAGVPFNNSNSVGVRGGWRYELSERSSLGVAVSANRIGYDLSAAVIDESLLLTGTYSIGRSTQMAYDVGATHTTSDGPSDTGGLFRIAFKQELTGVSTMNVGASQDVTPGTGLQGSSRDSGAWVSYERTNEGRGLRGAVNGAYWYRNGLSVGDTAASTSTTLNLTGSIGWTFNRYVGLNATYAFVDQVSKNGGTDAFDTRFSVYGINLRWAIRGR
jgi:hypothetical protein